MQFSGLNKLVEKLLSYTQRGSVLDLGAGAGGNSIFLARHGFDVTAVDISSEAIEDIRRTAAEASVVVQASVGDIARLEWDRSYDVIVCTMALHYLYARDALNTIRAMQAHTNPGGFNVIATFTKEGDLLKNDPTTERFLADGLEQFRDLYAGWNIHILVEKERKMRKTHSDGTPFINTAVGLIAQKIH
ncbi:hypothetical protein COU18_02555 [Candidatus Kaiserbacteria bacterium CG10_big_fil_rev_8_21_14_0_10_51_14]|uniref:Tellurite resistance methyltransferase TehB-like domain-containing protein n=1 Tax=Candidatus Kaiserbacteria bacterium CG10_big_fil_rev_8_21_14_0_10_51_14 TaxID=1974610 RepID=A0A2H0UAU4_9BACT|nr:MAG: hypothetical protein COU18_02555 [Candidatus Kaiserbacteria bacterium CG10_big_fil_rev_8_21_14_0_10_51_14]